MVIQRWQSVYLLVAALLMAFYAFLPIVGCTFGGDNYELTLLGINSLSPAGEDGATSVIPEVVSWPLFALAILIALLSVVTIFKFKQLKLQKTLCGVCIILTLALIASVVVLVNSWSDVRYYFSNCMPILAIVAYVMAAKGIAKDQKTLNSYDRLR